MLQAAALAPVVETGESEDVRTRVRLHCDSTGRPDGGKNRIFVGAEPSVPNTSGLRS